MQGFETTRHGYRSQHQEIRRLIATGLMALALHGCQEETLTADEIRSAQAARTPQQAAEQFAPCGGDPTGFWTLTYYTVDHVQEPTATFPCERRVRTVLADPTSTVMQFDNDGHAVSFFGVVGGLERFTYDDTFATSCSGGEDACVARGCSLSGTNECVCRGELEESLQLSGWWSLDGDKISVENADLPTWLYDYCESGSRLVLRYVDDTGVWMYVAERD